MKHTSKARYFLSGVLVTLLLVSMITPALATSLSKYIEVSTGVSVYVDDVKLDPRDANGNPVDVFIYNGTTYLPVRAISNSLGVPIQWEGSTRSVYVGKHQGDKPAVWLTDLDYFSGDKNIVTADSEKDNLGDTHYHCITESFTRTYAINGQYSMLTGSLYQTYENRSHSGTGAGGRTNWIRIYGDGELLYEYQLTGGMKPRKFNIDLTGVLDLQIKFDAYQPYSYLYSIGDAGLWT